MADRMKAKRPQSFGAALAMAALLGWLAACAPQQPATEAAGAPGTTPAGMPTETAATDSSQLDGRYAKLDPSWPQWWLCRRCADYRPAGGLWHFEVADGVMHLSYELTGWRSSAGLTLAEDRLLLSDDPYCPGEVGEYRWQRTSDGLRLTPVDDDCAFGLRAENLGGQPWTDCSMPQAASAPGCSPSVPPGARAASQPVGLTVGVIGGDSRTFEISPDLIVPANGVDNPSPAGIQVVNSPESIRYGLNQVLWGAGDWVEVGFDLTLAAVGVQFLGDPSIGWASVLLDGEEIWRGDTAAIWSEFGRHGGYVEVAGFGPGGHSLRVESLGFDYHPVTVAFFGFSTDAGVEPGAD